MIKKAVDFYYFSGTGNTLLVVKEMKEFFDKNNCPTSLHKIEKSNPKTIDSENMIGIAFPVACQSTYPFIWKFIESLPSVKNDSPVFIVDTLGAYSGGVIGPLKKLLKNKGFLPIGAKEIVMPNNFGAKENKKSEEKIKKGLKKARRFAHDIVYGFSKWNDVPIVSNLISKISKSDKVWNKIRKSYQLELTEEKCIMCNKCYQLCPIYNIEMEEFPEFSDHCQLCMRCYVFCPTDAITFKNKKMKKYTAVTYEELME